jgi:RNA polymerase sigma-70 factor (ECF subfamily)
MLNKFEKYKDEDLIIELKSDKKSSDMAFLVIYNRYSQQVYFYCLKVTGDEDTAKDIFQEVFIKFVDYALKSENMTSIKNYLIKIARSIWLESKKHNYNEVVLDLDIHNFGTEFHTFYDDEAKNDLNNYIDNCLNLLDEDEKEVIIMRQFQDMSYIEIEEITGISIKTCRMKYYRAKEKLKNMLTVYYDKNKQ